MPTNVITGQLPNQLPSMTMNTIPSNLGNIFSSLQGGLIGFPKVNNMGLWKLCNKCKLLGHCKLQALQTLVSIGMGNL
jgi:hypothetical protein